MADRAQPPLDLVSQGPCGDASIHTHLEDGRRICIRTVSPADEARLREGIARMSPRSRYLRFFSGGASPPDWVIERLLDADGVLHLAWGALDLGDPAQPAMGVVHAMRPDAGDAVAEFSVGVVDGKPVLDLPYVEDSSADVDMNVVATGAGRFVEVQGTGEEATFARAAASGIGSPPPATCSAFAMTTCCAGQITNHTLAHMKVPMIPPVRILVM